jgi:protein phosphatase
LAVDGITNYVLNAMDWVFQLDENSESNFELDLRKALVQSQEVLQNEAAAIPQRRGMATTLTMAYVDWPKCYVVHVGDTRCYHIRKDVIRCITTDHTIGELSRTASKNSDALLESPNKENDKETSNNPMNHALYNVIGGTDPELDPQVKRSELQVGDALLLCSDGLTRYLSDTELLKAIQQAECTAEETCRFLVDKANQRGGKDNITVVLAKFNENLSQQIDCEHEETTVTASSLNDTAKFIPSKIS